MPLCAGMSIANVIHGSHDSVSCSVAQPRNAHRRCYRILIRLHIAYFEGISNSLTITVVEPRPVIQARTMNTFGATRRCTSLHIFSTAHRNAVPFIGVPHWCLLHSNTAQKCRLHEKRQTKHNRMVGETWPCYIFDQYGYQL